MVISFSLALMEATQPPLLTYPFSRRAVNAKSPRLRVGF
jgi:hypothetical protein